MPDRPIELKLDVPPELEGGTYANVLNVWHTAYEFTLDFGVMQQVGEPEDAEAAVQVPVRVVSRVRIPVTLLFEVLKALNTNMTGYESTFGSIRAPEAPPQ
jgi:Protein of unknown function (DUF3467)